MNVELQKSILHTTELYNLESERQRLKTALATSLGPGLSRVVHDVIMDQEERRRAEEAQQAQREAIEARVAKMTERVTELQESAVPPGVSVGRGRMSRRPGAGGAGSSDGSRQMSLAQWAR